MSTIQIQALPKFPTSVEAGDGVTVTRSNGVFTFALDPTFVPSFSSALPLSAGEILMAVAEGDVGVIAAPAGGAVQTLVYAGSGVPSWTQLPLGAAVTGTLNVVNGGTGAATAASARANLAVAGLADANTFTVGQKILIGGGGGGLLVNSALGTETSSVNIGRTSGATELLLATVGANDAVYTGTLQGDSTIRANEALWLGARTGGTPAAGIRIASTGALRFLQHAGGYLKTDVSGNLSTISLGTAALKNTGTSGNTVPLLDGTNTWSAANNFVTPGQSAIVVTSGSSSVFASIGIGRTGVEMLCGVAGAANEFVTGTVAGEAAIRGTSGLWFGTASGTPAIKIQSSGALRFFQHVNGIVSTDGSGNVSTLSSTGTGNVVRTASPTITTPDIVGTTAGGNANAGSVGEIVVGDRAGGGSALGLTTATTADVVNGGIALGAGDWDVSALVQFNPNGSTTIADIKLSVGSTSATIDTTHGRRSIMTFNGTTPFYSFTMTIPPARFSLGSPGTVYLCVNATFGVSTLSVEGGLRARRVR